MAEKLIKPVGNYRKLLSYQKTEVIYEMTYFFCHHFLQRGDRTIDQMVQAARSGKQKSLRGAPPLPHRQRRKSNSSMWRKPVFRNCLRTISTICAHTAIANGKRSLSNGKLCADWARNTTMPLSLCNFARLDRQRPSPTWPSY